MHFVSIAILLACSISNALASVVDIRDGDHDNHDMDDSFNIFKDSNQRFEGAICKNQITTKKFPTLVVPPNFRGGCVRCSYSQHDPLPSILIPISIDYQGIDMTGIVTEVDIFFPKIKSACDCIAACLTAATTCTNWVFKHTFNAADSGRRACTLYSSPNLPTDVTLVYDLTNKTGLGLSLGYQLLQPQNNPQAGGGAPLTFLDAANTKQDPFGVSGFLSQDSTGKLYC